MIVGRVFLRLLVIVSAYYQCSGAPERVRKRGQMSRKTLKKFEKTLDRPVAVCYNGRKAPERHCFCTSFSHFGAERHHFNTSLLHFGAGSFRNGTGVPFKRDGCPLFSKATKVPFNKKGDDCPLIKLSGIQINLAGRNPYIFVERFFSVALNV